MKGKEARLEELFNRYVNHTATETEEVELMQLLTDAELLDKAAELIEQTYETMPAAYILADAQADNIFSKIVAKPTHIQEAAPVIKLNWKRWALAASVILMLGFATVFFIQESAKQNNAKQITAATSNDIMAPKTNRAMITLSNGQTVYLDNAVNGKLIQQNGVAITKLADGKIAYSGASTEPIYNTLSNPKGSKVIDMVLADGSRVWLNAGSSLTFPIAFAGSERKVSITGEAYFEVAKNTAMPFKVDVAGKCEVEVLGTHFNVNAYIDEATINTTLLEGSVMVTSTSTKQTQMITPGQQARLHGNAHISINTKPNISQVMAWKNGYLNFDDADLQMVMRQLARWYDVEIIYEGEMPVRQFAGEIQLDLNLSQMLRILESNNVHFRIEGKKLFVRN